MWPKKPIRLSAIARSLIAPPQRNYPLYGSPGPCGAECLSSHVWQRGGSAARCATILAEYGVNCEFFGNISNDIYGQFMQKDFAEHKISIENCRFYEEYESSVSTVWINKENGDRTIVDSKNGNMPEISHEDFLNLNLENYSWIHFQCQSNYESMKSNLLHLKEWNKNEANNVITVSIEVEKPVIELTELESLADLIFISKDFAIANGFTNMRDAVEALSCKLTSGGILICSWGEKGATAKSIDSPLYESISYPAMGVINTLGASGTFIGASIICLMAEKNLQDTIIAACKIAGVKCGMHDTSGLSTFCTIYK